MDFYRLDYWHEATKVDVLALHEQAADLIRFLPSAEAFLKVLSKHGKRVFIVTNADRQSFTIKDRALQLAARVNKVISSHDFGSPKEDNAFWIWLTEQFTLTPKPRCLLTIRQGCLGPRRSSVLLIPLPLRNQIRSAHLATCRRLDQLQTL